MSVGKMLAQAGHACLGAYKKVLKSNPSTAHAWEEQGQAKIALKVMSESELLEYLQKGKDAGIPCELIRDAGHTQVEPGTLTCFGAGPWDENELDKVFGKLKLL